MGSEMARIPEPVHAARMLSFAPDSERSDRHKNLHCLQGKLPRHATRNDWYMALAYTVRDRMMERYVAAVAELMRLLVDEHAIDGRKRGP
jgi:glucan phosphorylase